MFCSVSIESHLSIINKDEMSSASLAEKFNSSITHKSQIQYTDFFYIFVVCQLLLECCNKYSISFYY